VGLNSTSTPGLHGARVLEGGVPRAEKGARPASGGKFLGVLADALEVAVAPAGQARRTSPQRAERQSGARASGEESKKLPAETRGDVLIAEAARRAGDVIPLQTGPTTQHTPSEQVGRYVPEADSNAPAGEPAESPIHMPVQEIRLPRANTTARGRRDSAPRVETPVPAAQEGDEDARQPDGQLAPFALSGGVSTGHPLPDKRPPTTDSATSPAVTAAPTPRAPAAEADQVEESRPLHRGDLFTRADSPAIPEAQSGANIQRPAAQPAALQSTAPGRSAGPQLSAEQQPVRAEAHVSEASVLAEAVEDGTLDAAAEQTDGGAASGTVRRVASEPSPGPQNRLTADGGAARANPSLRAAPAAAQAVSADVSASSQVDAQPAAEPSRSPEVATDRPVRAPVSDVKPVAQPAGTPEPAAQKRVVISPDGQRYGLTSEAAEDGDAASTDRVGAPAQTSDARATAQTARPAARADSPPPGAAGRAAQSADVRVASYGLETERGASSAPDVAPPPAAGTERSPQGRPAASEPAQDASPAAEPVARQFASREQADPGLRPADGAAADSAQGGTPIAAPAVSRAAVSFEPGTVARAETATELQTVQEGRSLADGERALPVNGPVNAAGAVRAERTAQLPGEPVPDVRPRPRAEAGEGESAQRPAPAEGTRTVDAARLASPQVAARQGSVVRDDTKAAPRQEAGGAQAVRVTAAGTGQRAAAPETASRGTESSTRQQDGDAMPDGRGGTDHRGEPAQGAAASSRTPSQNAAVSTAQSAASASESVAAFKESQAGQVGASTVGAARRKPASQRRAMVETVAGRQQLVDRIAGNVTGPEVRAGIQRAVTWVQAQVVRQGQYVTSNGRSEVRLQLEPPELGRMKLEIEMKGEVLEVRIKVENPQVRDAIRSELPNLDRAFRDAQVDVGRFDVSDYGAGRGGDGAANARGDDWPGGTRGSSPEGGELEAGSDAGWIHITESGHINCLV